MWDSVDEQQRVLEALELADGELFLSGRTKRVPDVREAALPRQPAPQ
jgi:hypothetical protein